MEKFEIKPDIYNFEKLEEFIEYFKVGKNDLIITNRRYLTGNCLDLSQLKCGVIFKEDYGSGEPTEEMFEKIYAKSQEMEFDRVIAIGGGTVIDISKLLVLERVLPVIDLFRKKIETVKNKELIIIPTTCGTGSEVTNISILGFPAEETKIGLASDELYADYAVLIPELLNNLPFRYFATSSIDALIHAVESTLSPKSTDMSKMFGYKAIEIIIEGYMKIRDDGQEARQEMLDDFIKASNYAGIAFSNAGCAAVHALSYSLGTELHLAHGESNYMIFDSVMKKYMSKNKDGEIAVLSSFIADILGCEINEVFKELDALLGNLISRKKISDYDIELSRIEEYADSVIENQQRLLVNSFVDLSRDDILDIYRNIY